MTPGDEPEPLYARPRPARATAARSEDRLWARAPGWRNLLLGAGALTAAAGAVLVQPEPHAPPPPAQTSPAQSSPAQSLPPRPQPAGPPRAPAPKPTVAAAPAPAPRPTPALSAVETSTAPTPEPQSLAVDPPPALVPHVPPVSQMSAQAQPQVEPQACRLSLPASPGHAGEGVVVSVEDRATSLARISRTEASLGGRIDPSYVANARWRVSANGSTSVFIAPFSVPVHVGDRVMVEGPYRNPALACNYVPPLITADLGAAPASSTTPPP